MKIKCLGINLYKESKYLYIENYKTLMKQIHDTNSWRNMLCSWIGRISLVKISILPKAIYRFNAIPIQLPMVFFTELEQVISQFVWKHKKTSNSQSNPEKEEWNWRNQLAWLQSILQSYSHTVWSWNTDRNIDKWNKIEAPEINPCINGQLIFDKKTKVYNGEKTISLKSGAGKTGQPPVKEWN